MGNLPPFEIHRVCGSIEYPSSGIVSPQEDLDMVDLPHNRVEDIDLDSKPGPLFSPTRKACFNRKFSQQS